MLVEEDVVVHICIQICKHHVMWSSECRQWVQPVYCVGFGNLQWRLL